MKITSIMMDKIIIIMDSNKIPISIWNIITNIKIIPNNKTTIKNNKSKTNHNNYNKTHNNKNGHSYKSIPNN